MTSRLTGRPFSVEFPTLPPDSWRQYERSTQANDRDGDSNEKLASESLFLFKAAMQQHRFFCSFFYKLFKKHKTRDFNNRERACGCIDGTLE